MPLIKVSFRPGVNKESTTYANEGTYFDCNWVRFRAGYPEKIGGWQNLSHTNTFKGIARNLFAWTTYAAKKLLGVGTSQKYYIEYGTYYYDITPVRATSGNLTNPLTTTLGSKLITVTHSAHGAAAGTYVRITSTLAVGGLLINGDYEILTAPSGSTYTIAASTAASASATGGGTVTATYDISAESSTFTQSNDGWSAGAYGNGGWGNSTGTVILPSIISTPLRLWSQCLYGEDLIFAPRSGTLYYWDVDTGSFPRAVTVASKANTLGKVSYDGVTAGSTTSKIIVTDTTDIDIGAVVSGTGIPADTYIVAADYVNKEFTLSAAVTAGFPTGFYTFSHVGRAVPTQTEYVLAADAAKFIICLGANPYEPGNFGTTYDPMLVRWSDQDNCYEWVPAITNQAGEYRLSIGTYLVTAQNTRQEILVWSNAALYSMQYLGPPNVFGFTLLGDNLSIASPSAAVTVNNIALWMGYDKFYIYSGRVETLPCTLHKHVFHDFNRNRIFQVVAGSNEAYNEVWWFYPSANSDINDRYVIYNYLEQVWSHGELSRTAWLDSSLRPNPMAAFSTQTTHLTATLAVDGTKIKVNDASSYPPSGIVTIDNEDIAYSSRSYDELTVSARGANATEIAEHPAYTYAYYGVPNQVMYHEVGTDDSSLPDPQPIDAYIESADFDIGDGHDFGFVWRILPDLTFNGSTATNPQIYLEVQARTNSGTAYRAKTPPTVTRTATIPIEEFTGQVYIRIRGRQMKLKIASDEVGIAWQLGQTRIDIRPDGRKI